jgi:hypothetical protein
MRGSVMVVLAGAACAPAPVAVSLEGVPIESGALLLLAIESGPEAGRVIAVDTAAIELRLDLDGDTDLRAVILAESAAELGLSLGDVASTPGGSPLPDALAIHLLRVRDGGAEPWMRGADLGPVLGALRIPRPSYCVTAGGAVEWLQIDQPIVYQAARVDGANLLAGTADGSLYMLQDNFQLSRLELHTGGATITAGYGIEVASADGRYGTLSSISSTSAQVAWEGSLPSPIAVEALDIGLTSAALLTTDGALWYYGGDRWEVTHRFKPGGRGQVQHLESVGQATVIRPPARYVVRVTPDALSGQARVSTATLSEDPLVAIATLEGRLLIADAAGRLYREGSSGWSQWGESGIANPTFTGGTENTVWIFGAGGQVSRLGARGVCAPRSVAEVDFVAAVSLSDRPIAFGAPVGGRTPVVWLDQPR